MDDAIISIDKIQAEAQAAAERCENPSTACRYSFGSPAARIWYAAYAKAINRAIARDRAAQQRADSAIDIGDAA